MDQTSTQSLTALALRIAALLLLLAAPSAAQDDRSELPNGPQLETLRSLIRSEHGGAPTGISKKSCGKLASDLLSQFEDADSADEYGRYALLELARDCAVKAGNVTTTMRASDLLAEHYQLDPMSNEMSALCAVLRGANQHERGQGLPRLLRAIHAAIAARRWQLVEAGMTIAEDRANTMLLGRLRKSRDTLDRDAQWLRALEADCKAAPASSSDASPDQEVTTNTRSGIGKCVLDDDWDAGCALLTRGKDESWARAARADRKLRQARGNQRRLLASDASLRWLELAEAHSKQSHTAATALLRRAQMHLEGASAVSVRKLSKRASKLESQLSDALRFTPGATKSRTRSKLADWFPVGSKFSMERTRSIGDDTPVFTGTVVHNDGRQMHVVARALGGGAKRRWEFELDDSGEFRLVGVPKHVKGRGGIMRNYESDLEVDSKSIRGTYSWELKTRNRKWRPVHGVLTWRCTKRG